MLAASSLVIRREDIPMEAFFSCSALADVPDPFD
jgi:hypothetical protein